MAGRVPFLNLVEAQRNHVGLKNRYFESVAEAFRRRASLERAGGQPLPITRGESKSNSATFLSDYGFAHCLQDVGGLMLRQMSRVQSVSKQDQ